MAKVMKAKDFVNKALVIANQYKTLYVMGCFGSPLNATNKKRYENNYAYNKQAKRKKMIQNASSDTFGFDCVCLIKGILWGWNGNKKATYGGAKYCANGVSDFGSDGIMNYCTNVSTNFKSIEVGEIVHMKGHVGIYIGNGLVVECSPAWKNKVQITACQNIGKKKGYKNRKWTNHGKLKYIEYEKNTQAPSVSTTTPTTSVKYYKKYTGKSNSIVDALKSIKVDSSFSNRKKIAKANGIKAYLGLPSQNIKLLKLLKQGKLVK